MVTDNTFIFELNRKQKRLLDWRKSLLDKPKSVSKQEVKDLLETFGLLIERVAKLEAGPERTQEWNRLVDFERQLNRRFKDAHLMTRRGRSLAEAR